MQTALGGAGLAVAFNAPIGGTLFTLEEVTKSFRVKTVLATLFSCAAAVACSRLVLGNHANFQVKPIDAPSLAWLPLFVVFGLLTGCLGAVYNRLVLWFLDHVAAIRRIPTLAKAAIIGAGRRARDVRVPAGGEQQDMIEVARRTTHRSCRRRRTPCGAVRRRPPVVLGGGAWRPVRATAGRGFTVGAPVRRRLQLRVAWRRNAVGGSDGARRNGGILRGHGARAGDRDGRRHRDDGHDRDTRADDGRHRCCGARRVRRRWIAADLREPSRADARRGIHRATRWLLTLNTIGTGRPQHREHDGRGPSSASIVRGRLIGRRPHRTRRR